MARQSTIKSITNSPDAVRQIYTFEIFIVDGPITRKFAKKNKVISRTIQIRGEQTLATLHDAIFDAFDREEEHMYEFQIGGEGPMDPKARRYGLPEDKNDLSSDNLTGDVERTTIGSLGLTTDDVFGYWFDFGDDWWHQINVEAIEEKVERGKLPRVTKRIGQSPPQYVDWDEEDE